MHFFFTDKQQDIDIPVYSSSTTAEEHKTGDIQGVEEAVTANDKKEKINGNGNISSTDIVCDSSAPISKVFHILVETSTPKIISCQYQGPWIYILYLQVDSSATHSSQIPPLLVKCVSSSSNLNSHNFVSEESKNKPSNWRYFKQ